MDEAVGHKWSGKNLSTRIQKSSETLSNVACDSALTKRTHSSVRPAPVLPQSSTLLRAVNSNGTLTVTDQLRGTSGNGVYIVAGHQHSGKSRVLRQLYDLWEKGEVLGERSVVIRWDLSEVTQSAVNSLKELVSLCGSFADRSEWSRLPQRTTDLQADGGQKVAIMVDNFTQSSAFLTKLLSRAIIPRCSIILAVQYTQVEMVLAEVSGEYQIFEMKGLCMADVGEEILRKGQELRLKSIDRLSDYVRANPDVQDLCCNPGLLLRVLKVFREKRYQCPKTVTLLVKAIVDDIVSEASPLDDMEEHLDILCFLAFEDLNYGGFSQYEFSCLCSELSISGSGTQLGLGLMQLQVEKDHIKCKFIHGTIQDYLAARHVRKKPIFDQAHLTMKLATKAMSDDNCYRTLVYYCGTAHTLSTQSSSLNIPKIIMYPLLESLAGKISLDGRLDSKMLVFFLRCLHEAQEQSTVRKFLSRRQHALTIELESHDKHLLAESNLVMLSYCIANSGINKWTIEALSKDTFLMEYLKMLIEDQLSSENKSNFEVKVVVGSSNKISPAYPAMTPTSKPMSSIYSKIIRELLHRLLQLHSPIKLKSDGSNASYISLLACECLQKAVESNHVLAIECIPANHWLPMKKKQRTSSTQSEVENPQTMFHMERNHDGQHIEFVVMTSPLPHRLKFTMPGTKEMITIELCTGNSPSFLHSGIEDGVNFNSETAVYQDTSYNSSTAKIVLPDLPLPKQTNSSAVTVAPDVPEQPRSNRDIHRLSNQENAMEAMATPVAATSLHHLSATNGGRRDQGSTQSQQRQNQAGIHNRSPVNFVHGSTFEPSEQQSQLPKQSSMKPGVVLHTMIPEIFATDQQYPLPDETQLLRKGGNGEIYVGTFGGKELIVKKTAFRNREFMIHSKLQHQNIIALQCLMIGERNPLQRRKLTCFHFLPRASGDLAKLAIDSERNTLKQLRIDHGQNVKLFGSIQGNVKYLLTQILKGLAYLHNQEIIHRDLKASNILLTFRCSCTNPLLCTCANKCAVQIADFDSSIKLVNGFLPASSSRGGQAEKTFVVVPVGTHSYRPPESSQLTVSNDVTMISPNVTTRADIWSFGVLTMKMLNGRYGPASQRELSTLLLLYHQEIRTSSTRRGRVSVKPEDVTKILKISKLQQDLYWSPKAVDCVKQCLQVDPQKRTGAQELLQHPFLY